VFITLNSILRGRGINSLLFKKMGKVGSCHEHSAENNLVISSWSSSLLVNNYLLCIQFFRNVYSNQAIVSNIVSTVTCIVSKLL